MLTPEECTESLFEVLFSFPEDTPDVVYDFWEAAWFKSLPSCWSLGEFLREEDLLFNLLP